MKKQTSRPDDFVSGEVAYRARAEVARRAENVGQKERDLKPALRMAKRTAQLEAANRELEASEERYRLLFEANPMPMWVFDPDTLKFLAVNEASIQHYGYSREEFLAMTVKDIRPPEEVPRLLEYLAQAKVGPLPRLVWTHWKKDRTPIQMKVTNHAIIYGGRPARLALANDVTEREKAEDALRRSEERYRLLFESNPMPMWVYDPEKLRFLDVNKAAIEHYGYSREEFLALGLAEIRPREDVAFFLDYMERARTTGEMPRLTWRHRKKNGAVIFVEVITRDIVFDGDRPARLSLGNDVTEHKQAEEALRRSEALLRALSDAMPQIVWGADRKGNITYFNERAFQFHGLPAEKLYGMAWLGAVHPDEQEATRTRWRHSIDTGEDYEIQYRLRRADGVYRWHLARALLVQGEAAQSVQWFGTKTDIDDQVRAQTQLAEAQGVARMGSWSRELPSEKVVWSAELYRIFGLTPEAFTPSFEAVAQLIHPEDRETFLQEAQVNRLLLQPSENYYRVIRADGTERTIHHRVVVEVADGKPVRVYGTAQDVTEMRAAEEKIRKQASLLNLAHDAIIVRDLDDRVEFWNRGAEQLYGYSPRETIGRRITEILYEDNGPYFAAKKQVLETGQWSGELRQLRKDGAVLIVHCHWSLVRDEKENPLSVIAINNDISEQKKLEMQFLRAQRLESIGTLASGVAHDLNNVLVPILMVAPLLRGEISNAEREKFLSIVESSAERGAAIVKQVLTFARGADGTRMLLQPVYLLQEMAKIAEETFPRNITVRTRYPETLSTLEADPTQLHQVLLNLCVNARDAMPNGGTLTLAAENFAVDEHYASMTPGAKAGPHVVLQVTDTGTGIPRNVLDKIFDPFFSTKEIGVGTGLGLSTVLGIVKSHGGFMNVHSEAGHTSFKVFLPALGEAQDAGSAAIETDIPLGHGETILVVDDEPGIIEIARALLVKNGYQVLTADDGPSGLAVFAQNIGRIHLVLTDMVMPFMEGLVLVRALRRIDPAVRIMVSTGRDEDCRTEELKSLHVQACLTKPYTRRTLLTTIHEILTGVVPPGE